MGIGRWLRQVQDALDPGADEPVALPWAPPDTPWPRHAGLEEALRRDPDDRTMLAVYADWLQEQGDVRGAVLAAALAGLPEASIWGSEHMEPGGALRDWMLGPFARTLEIGPSHVLHMRGPFDHASCSILRTLRVTAEPERVGRLLEGRRTPCPIRTLVVDAGYAELTPIWPHLTTIETVDVQSARLLGEVRSPTLRTLKLHSVAQRMFADLSAGWLPNLTQLELPAQRDDPGSVFSAAMTALPLLDSLRVRSVASGRFVDRLVQGGVGARLRSLELPGARWDALQALTLRCDAFQALDRLVLPALTRATERHDVSVAFGDRTAIEWA